MFTACGIEGLVSNGTSDDFSRPVVEINGGLAIDVRPPADEVTEDTPSPVYFVDAAGEVIEPVSDDVTDSTYQLRLPIGVYENGLVVAEQNQVRLARYFGVIGDEFDTQTTDGADLDFDSTAVALIIDTYLAAFDKTLQVISGANVDRAIARIRASFDSDSPARRVRDRVAELYALGRTDRVLPIFNEPDFGTVAGADPNNPDLVVQVPVANESTINPLWLERFGPDGINVATTTTAFDADLGLAALASQLEGCPDPDQIQVVFEVNFNDGTLDQNCSSIV
ncbi:MAG: hypothetical protein AAFV29_14825, partial [Myxococcota bacterium]